MWVDQVSFKLTLDCSLHCFFRDIYGKGTDKVRVTDINCSSCCSPSMHAEALLLIRTALRHCNRAWPRITHCQPLWREEQEDWVGVPEGEQVLGAASSQIA